MKHSKILFGFLSIVGIVFLILIPIGSYLYYRDSVNILASLNMSTQLGSWGFLSGIGLVTIGIIGLDWKNARKYRKRFVALYVLIIPIAAFIIVLIASVFPNVGFISILRSEITQVKVIDSDPLVLSVDVKAITSRTSRIESATVFDNNNTFVAQTDFDDRVRFEHEDYTGLALALLPAHSEITVILNFYTNLTSGNYVVDLSSWHVAHDSSPFTIP